MQAVLNESEQVSETLAALRDILGGGLQAVYLHGSAASGRLRPQSDIDLLAVVRCGLTESERASLLSSLLRLSGRYPSAPSGPRCLEVMVFSHPDLTAGLFPARADFVFGEWLRDGFAAGEAAMPTQNPELTLVLAQARQEAIALLGPDRDELLPEVPMTEIRDAMRELLPALLKGLQDDTRNALLTLARMWHTADEGTFVSKDEAAAWAIPQLSDQSASILDHARRAYLGEISESWSSRQKQVQSLAEELVLHVTEALSA
ncbi:aminoglycoside adenylyltransferase family protein [Paenirhodobacter populi]|uniref:Aminoglycoside (3'') (9) adenylyltransferase n=1 Tax=Paenirhodobacter populi TaxID=2306993 RepID=A0A443J8L9_9RHOB|nr:aminoglycoside adenylyltransferase family protein [Sinirhodobacter populi]RWR16834.1 DUF4111 domain-containing protein [Sinirhodobacter populi]